MKETCIFSGETDATLNIGESFVYRTLPSESAVALEKQFNKLTTVANNKFIETEFKTQEEGLLVHKKITFASYPHEWCAAMLKDAALFELELLQDLYQQGYFLKDLHPWNVLFENGEFKHIDLPSLVEFKDLPNEMKLDFHTAKTGDAVKILLNDMLVPYFIYPLLGMAYGKREWVRDRIFNTTLNAASSTLTLRDLVPAKAFRLSAGRKVWRILSAKCKLSSFTQSEHQSIDKQIKSIINFVKSIPVSIGKSDYCHYYNAKGEAQTVYDAATFNDKQKNVLFAIDDADINTVCDVACNTGWFAKLAASLGKKVIAFDIDEACIEDLYLHIRNQKLNIVPVVASFMKLSPNRYSHQNGKRVLIAANERFQSDCVLALGIIHHLILGENINLDIVIENLILLTKKTLVLEFIDLKDEKIANHTDFFPAYHHSPESFEHYQQSNIIHKLEKYFTNITVEPSSEPTRTLIICRNRVS